MKYCEKCKVEVETSNHLCPLCYGELVGECEIVNETFKPRETNKKERKSVEFSLKLLGFLSVCISIICVFINLVVNPNIHWAIVVVLSILEVWILVIHTILSKRSLFEKILFQLIMILSILFACERVLPNGSRWMVSYVCPCIAYAVILTLNIFSIAGGKNHKNLLTCILYYILILTLSIIGLALNLVEEKTLYYIALIYVIISLIGTFTFGNKLIINELKAKFHI